MHRLAQYRKQVQDWLHDHGGLGKPAPDPAEHGISIDIAQCIVNHERNLYLNNKPYVHQPSRNSVVPLHRHHGGDHSH